MKKSLKAPSTMFEKVQAKVFFSRSSEELVSVL